MGFPKMVRGNSRRQAAYSGGVGMMPSHPCVYFTPNAETVSIPVRLIFTHAQGHDCAGEAG
jgi:hypothetical protein